ncbi:hypothetical protein [Actinokineospora inagensis]|uniref:hypothetical protein n=1 Tax=Actinokineospora inagensis TaxID=103730 RepID=UPI00040B29A0|nr:hypothetical protein [Actinokineospora inagensis]
MTDELRGASPDGPPWSVDLLADLHAGVLDPQRSARLWPRVNADPAARAVVNALESVRVGLGELSAAPVPPMPTHLAARLDAAIAVEAGRAFGHAPVAVQEPPRPAPVIDLAEARRKRNRRTGLAVGLVAAAAAAVAIGYGVLPTTQPTGGVAEPAPTASKPGSSDQPGAVSPIPVQSNDLIGATAKVGNKKDYGFLKNADGLGKCLTANGQDAKAQPIGVSPVTLDGTPGVMAILLTGQIGRLRVVVVQPDCHALFNDVIGR